MTARRERPFLEKERREEEEGIRMDVGSGFGCLDALFGFLFSVVCECECQKLPWKVGGGLFLFRWL